MFNITSVQACHGCSKISSRLFVCPTHNVRMSQLQGFPSLFSAGSSLHHEALSKHLVGCKLLLLSTKVLQNKFKPSGPMTCQKSLKKVESVSESVCNSNENCQVKRTLEVTPCFYQAIKSKLDRLFPCLHLFQRKHNTPLFRPTKNL